MIIVSLILTKVVFAGATSEAACVTTRNDVCKFPFTYKGVSYHKCTFTDTINKKPWCATVPRVKLARNGRVKNGRDVGDCDLLSNCQVEKVSALRDFGRGRSRPQTVDGRPFVVHGKSRTTSSKTIGSNPNHSESWKTGSVPSISPDSPDNQEIGLYWLRQAEAEHASVASFARHTLQLMSLGAPAHLLAASQQASLDEIKHAKICYEFASAFLGQDFGPGLLDVDESLENMDLKEIIRSVIVEGCIGETLSAAEAHLAAHYAQDPAVKDALEQIASEETNHGQLAWDTIKWIIEKHPESRSYVDGIFQAELEQRRMPERNGTALPLTALCQDSEKKTSLRRYGLIDGDDRVKVGEAGIRDIIEPVYRDGFKHVNIISEGIKQLDVSVL